MTITGYESDSVTSCVLSHDGLGFELFSARARLRARYNASLPPALFLDENGRLNSIGGLKTGMFLSRVGIFNADSIWIPFCVQIELLSRKYRHGGVNRGSGGSSHGFPSRKHNESRQKLFTAKRFVNCMMQRSVSVISCKYGITLGSMTSHITYASWQFPCHHRGGRSQMGPARGRAAPGALYLRSILL